MIDKTSIIALLAIALLTPLGSSVVFAQEIPGQESEWEPVTVNEDYPELSPEDAQHLVELTKHEDPSLVNEYQELHRDIINWLANDSHPPVGLSDDMKIAGTGTMGSAGLLITVHESNGHLIPEYKEVFAGSYPNLNFEFGTVGDVTWNVGPTTYVDMGHMQ